MTPNNAGYVLKAASRRRIRPTVGDWIAVALAVYMIWIAFGVETLH